MGRIVFFCLATVCTALVAGCGAADPVAERPAPAASSSGPATVELTDGRLGDATAVRAGARPREISHGGRPILRPPRSTPLRAP